MDVFLTGNYNEQVIKFIQSYSNPFLDKFFIFITICAEQYSLIILMALIYWFVDKKIGYKLALAIISGTGINLLFKNYFKVKRPIGEIGIRSLRTETAGGYSFPSGHSEGISLFWTTIIMENKKRWTFFVGILFIFLVGLSRLYLGVHRLSDVIVGISIGVIWAIFSGWIFDIIDKENKYYLFSLYFIPLIIGFSMTESFEYVDFSFALLGIILGYFIEKKYVNYEIKKDIVTNMKKLLIGVGVLLILIVLYTNLIPKGNSYIMYFLASFWITGGSTYIFNKIIK